MAENVRSGAIVETPVKKFTKNIGIEFYHSDL